MRRRHVSLAAIAVTICLTGAIGCVMPDQLNDIKKDLSDVRQQLDQIETEQAASREQIAVLTAEDRNTDAVTKQDVADLGYRLNQNNEDMGQVEAQLQELVQRIDMLSEQMVQTRDQVRRSSIGSPGTQTAQMLAVPEETPGGSTAPAGSTVAGSTTAVPVVVPGGGSNPLPDPEDLYNTSYADFMKGNYTLAISGFQDFVDSFPDSALADNAMYSIAECYYSQGAFADAIGGFDRMLERFPTSDKAASADLKKGLAYIEQNQIQLAIVQLQHVISRYPGTDESRIAEDKLKSFGS